MVYQSLFPSFLNSFKYRDRMTIIGDILKTLRKTKEGKRKTQIMQSANLNYIQMNKYLRYLLEHGLLNFTDQGKVTITEEGIRFLQYLEAQRIKPLM